MGRRWIIRSLFLLPLVCIVVACVTSYFGEIDAEAGVADRSWGASCVQGLGSFGEIPGGTDMAFYYSPGATADDWDCNPTTMGFRVGRFKGIPDSLIFVFPLWLPMMLLVGLNWFVWRKTRPKPKGGAFPVTTDFMASKTN